MLRWLRPGGLAICAGVLAILALCLWLFAGWLIERSIEEAGTAALGARVELDSVDLDLAPLAVTLNRLQVTDPGAPMQNAVEVRRLHAGIEVGPLLRRKVLIDALAVEGVRFGTPRTRSGALDASHPRVAAIEKLEGLATQVELPSFDPPDVADILAREPLESLAAIEEARAAVDGGLQGWLTRLDSLPDEARFADYKRRIDALGRGNGVAGALGSASEIAQIQREVKQDLDSLQAASRELTSEVERLRGLAERAARAPGEDARRLQSKYGLSATGLANLGGLLLGPEVRARLGRWLGWWQRAEPLISRTRSDAASEGGVESVKPLRGPGVDVRFPERTPLPDFLIRHADVSVEITAGTLLGRIENLTPDQPIHGRPLELAFAGDSLQGLGSLRLEGTFDRRTPAEPADDLRLDLKGLQLADLPLAEGSRFGLLLERGALDLEGRARSRGGSLSADVRAGLVDLTLQPRFADSGEVARAIGETIAGVRRLHVEARLAGSLEAPELSVRSPDLDSLLQQAVGRLLAGQMKRFESALGAAIGERTQAPLAALQKSAGGLGGLEQELAKRTELGSSLLSTGAGGGGLRLPFGPR